MCSCGVARGNPTAGGGIVREVVLVVGSEGRKVVVMVVVVKKEARHGTAHPPITSPSTYPSILLSNTITEHFHFSQHFHSPLLSHYSNTSIFPPPTTPSSTNLLFTNTFIHQPPLHQHLHQPSHHHSLFTTTHHYPPNHSLISHTLTPSPPFPSLPPLPRPPPTTHLPALHLGSVFKLYLGVSPLRGGCCH
ncbi:hypothetical protein Pcinc_022066 [Petrolisthes cinctipes]|uniref:Uncharacterized protein n=1 Tax=Petrolisthes cinctipes TaxID=88211 RepID=A0AAE1FG76_PETCI|nr:hypothetical protein Pcinc_022066 [Petrolisthes cinctipes]